MRDLDAIAALARRISNRASVSDHPGLASDVGALADLVAELADSVSATDLNASEHVTSYHAGQI